MCGIAGFYGFRDDNLIKKFSEQLWHRGPDGVGYFINDQVSLLNRRLAIIDRKGGDQPIYNEDKSVVVTYNGEIYNYRELRTELEKQRHRFSTKSDTEVIVHGYEQWGEKCFDRFNGMFAVALYDIKKEKLILARDHFGIKPLYFALVGQSETKIFSQDQLVSRRTSGSVAPRSSSESEGSLRRSLAQTTDFQKNFVSFLKIVFSSEIKPLIYSGLIAKKPNVRIIYRYLTYRVHDDQRETFFEGVYRLMPGEMMTIQNDKLKISKYTNLERELEKMAETRHALSLQGEDLEIFKKKLINAIRLRLISEVPVGTCLSGGLDSSTVVSVINKLLKEHVKEAESVGKIQKTFSAVFPGGSNNEEKYIDEMCRGDFKNRPYKIKGYKINPTPEEFFKEIEEFVKTQEEPTISSGPYAQYKVMQLAHKKVTVLLDGQGSDEMMAGYDPYFFVYLKQLIREKRLIGVMRELWGMRDIILKYLRDKILVTFLLKQVIKPPELLNDSFQRKFKKEKFVVTNDNLRRRLVEDIFSNSLQSLLRYEDRNSMKFSIEGRVPFLDFNLLRYLFTLPDEAIIKNGWNKFVLRQSVKDLLPKLIVDRRNKIGFTTPEYEWFMRMKNKIYQIFLSESFAKRKYFNQQEVLKAFQLFIEGKVNDTMLFWRLLNVEMWMRIFIDPSYKVYKVIKFIKKDIGPNEGKKLEIKVDGRSYMRYPIRTELFKKGDNYAEKIANYFISAVKFLSQVNSSLEESRSSDIHFRKNFTASIFKNKKFFLVISEKIVAIAQGRSYFIWDIKPNFWANLLSKFVKKTPYGIGLGSPWTMQLAIREIGVIRVISAAIIAAVAKPFGFHGLFYRIAGSDAASIDGPTEYSLYPSNVSAKLGPKEPQKVTEEIKNSIVKLLNGYIAKNNTAIQQYSNFLGAVIIDANDLGQRVLGNSTNLDNKLIEKIFSDNPIGQADEQTPLCLVFEKNKV